MPRSSGWRSTACSPKRAAAQAGRRAPSWMSAWPRSGGGVGPAGLVFPGKGAAEVPLEPYDNVLIFQQPDFDFQRNVVLLGEVRYAGTYSLRTKGDRLAELIARAGGLTTRAYPEGIRFFRK